tara:strand:- start:6721 stop:8256 length:1536 start_codon:yes stop_codon:yes gene_type:complete
MADVSFNVANPYQTQLDELARRQKMAEIMQQQSFQPAERFSYQGIEAPISPLTGLSKALQMYMSGREQGKISEERKALGERYRQEGMDDITRYAEIAGRPAVAAVPGSEAFMPTGADYEDRGGAPAFKLNEQGMVPAVDPVAARMRGQIDPSMIGQFNTPEMRRMALAQMLKQGELPAAFNLGADETRFQPPVGGGAPVAVARGAAKPLPSPFAPVDVSKFTQASVTAAMKPDGTIDRTLLVPIPERRTGQLGVYDEYVAQEKAAGRVPKSIEMYEIAQKKAGRPDPAVTYGSPIAATDLSGNAVFLQPGRTGNAPSVIQGFTPPAEKLRPIPATINTAIIGNQTASNQLDRAIALLSGKDLPGMVGDVNATGMKGYLPTGLLNRLDPQGVSARAEIADIGSLKLHDRSGAAVTAAESPRLVPFIPLSTDDNATALKKLGRLKLELENESKAMRDIYSKEQGYKENPVLNKPSVAEKITTIAEITDAAKKTGKTVEQVTKDAIAKGYKVNP